jgi:hypothetical protein
MGAKRPSCRAVEMVPPQIEKSKQNVCWHLNIAGRSDPRIDANEYEQHMGIWTQIMGTSKVVVIENTETY